MARLIDFLSSLAVTSLTLAYSGNDPLKLALGQERR